MDLSFVDELLRGAEVAWMDSYHVLLVWCPSQCIFHLLHLVIAAGVCLTVLAEIVDLSQMSTDCCVCLLVEV